MFGGDFEIVGGFRVELVETALEILVGDAVAARRTVLVVEDGFSLGGGKGKDKAEGQHGKP